MIDVQDAVRNAFEYIENLFDDEEIKDLRLEEIELTDDENFWLVTLGFFRSNVQDDQEGILASVVTGPPKREYKIMRIRAEDGEVRAMKIRQFS